MPSVSVRTTSGSAIEFDIPEPGSRESCFFVGVQKGGSTMLAKIANGIAQQSDLSFYSFPIDLWKKGVKFNQLSNDVERIFTHKGYCYAGFKGLIDPVRLPATASGRTIFLVRDPRDMLTSQYFSVGISHPPPGSTLSGDRKRAFDARRARVREMSIDDYVLEASSGVARAYEKTLTKLTDIDHKIYHYENVVFEKINWIGDIADYLKIDLNAKAIDAIVRRVDVVPQAENAAQHIRKVTPGDHKEKLRAETIDSLNKKLSDILITLGYN